MSHIEIVPQLNAMGIALIAETLTNVFERGQYGKGLNASEQIQPDIAYLVENLDDQGCQILGRGEVQNLEAECWSIIAIILKNVEKSNFSDTAEALRFAREQIEKNIVTQRLGKCQELMKYVNGYDCYDLIWDDGHSFDKAMDRALTKMRKLSEDEQSRATSTGQKAQA